MDELTSLKVFVPMTKIDTAQRLVYGVVTAERPDVAGEICDYATTKPRYEKWSRTFSDATDGRSLGNLRAMHGNVAAGKLVDIAFNDEARQVEICGKVIDDGEWQKVEEGVYTGFSQGGRYLKRWPDPDQPTLTRYTAQPLEVSLVDYPCLPDATFAVVKADGSTELRKFKGASDRGGSDHAAAAAKVGARHSSADKTRIRAIHDILAELDPDCCGATELPGARVDRNPLGTTPEQTDPAGEARSALLEGLAKAIERPLAKALAGVSVRLDEIAARVKTIEDQPLPLGTGSVRVIEKSDDSRFAGSDALLDRPGALEALAELAIRKAQANPMRTMPGVAARKE